VQTAATCRHLGHAKFSRFFTLSHVVRGKKEVYGSLVDLREFERPWCVCVPVNRAALILEQKSGTHILVCRNRNCAHRSHVVPLIRGWSWAAGWSGGEVWGRRCDDEVLENGVFQANICGVSEGLALINSRYLVARHPSLLDVSARHRPES
jgi:hypothetical protein